MSDPLLSLTVTVKTKDALGQASPWIRFLSILGFIGVGILAVAGAGDPTDLEAFAVQVRGLSRFYGIFAIVMIAVYAVAIIAVVLFLALR